VSSEIRIVGLVADDLTGATDSAVQFAEAGWTASVERVCYDNKMNCLVTGLR
jgi:uncharacterized protein YgbK (DUF1537 family)